MTPLARAQMKQLQLTTIVRDLQHGTMTALTFTHAPVLVGRQYGNQLRLDARIVSRRHGAFLFSKDGLQYIDYASANGSVVDGVRVAPNRPVDIRNSSVVTIAPFQIIAHLDLVDRLRLANDPDVATRVEIGGDDDPGPPGDPRDPSEPSDSAERLRHASRVIAVVAERLLAAGSRTAKVLSSLRLATSPDEMVALLLDPSSGGECTDELRELLDELLRAR